ncbi:MAG: hypothetical protein ACTHZ7_06140 [Sphingobacterium sp.]
MKTNVKSIVMMFVTLLALNLLQSCKKDNNIDPNLPPDETVQKLELEGRWKIESVNFLDETVKWKEEVAFTSESRLGWAPAMYAKTMGVNFQVTEVKNTDGEKLGNKFSLIVGEDLPLSEANTYWYWNYIEDQQEFEMKQINSTEPPYDFSIMNISGIKIENDGDKVVFQAKLNSRKPGQAINETIQVPVEFILVRGVPTVEANILLKGQTFVLPDVELTEEENQAVLVAELKEKMGFNSNYISIQYRSTNPAHMFYYMTTIDDMDWSVLNIENPRDNNSTKFLAPFVCFDKNNTLYFYFANSGTTYDKYQIEKEGNLYTIIGEHEDNNFFFNPAYRNIDVSARLKVTYDIATKETVVVQEIFIDMGESSMVYLDPILKWTQDTNIQTHSLTEDEELPFYKIEL